MWFLFLPLLQDILHHLVFFSTFFFIFIHIIKRKIIFRLLNNCFIFCILLLICFDRFSVPFFRHNIFLRSRCGFFCIANQLLKIIDLKLITVLTIITTDFQIFVIEVEIQMNSSNFPQDLKEELSHHLFTAAYMDGVLPDNV